MAEWQPIETAPKDRWILLYGESHDTDYSSVQAGRWYTQIEEVWEQVDRRTKKLREPQDFGYWQCDLCPTHWMPFPDPPAPEGTQP